MRVLINALPAVGARTGIGHYISETVRCLRSRAGPGEVATFPAGWLHRGAELWSRVRPWALRQGGPTSAAAGNAPPDQPGLKGRLVHSVRTHGRALVRRAFRAELRRGRYDLYHEPNFIPVDCDVPTVVTVHDLSVLLHPSWHPRDRVAHFEANFRAGLARCSHFLAISESARAEILDSLGLPPGRVSCTPMGVRPGLGPLPEEAVRTGLARLGLPPRYLLYLGTLEPRKNVATLLRAYCSLPGPLREHYPLLLVGGWGWNAGDVAEYLDREAKPKGVRHLGYVADEHLPLLYNGARALLFPSFYEGFGLPPVEMLACGGAVLASTAVAVAETVGGQAHLIDPRDVDGWREGLRRVLVDDDWWGDLRQGGPERVAGYTWEHCAERTLEVYRALGGGAARAA